MLKIKAKKGYNVIIADLNLTLRSDGDWIEVDKQTFENSEDVKKLKKLIEIAELELNVKEKKEEVIDNENTVLQVAETSFVVSPKVETEKNEVFIKEEPIVEEAVEAIEGEEEIEGTVLDIDIEEEVKEEIPVETEVSVEETKIEAEVEIVETQKVKEEVKKATKPSTPKKPSGKKPNNKK